MTPEDLATTYRTIRAFADPNQMRQLDILRKSAEAADLDVATMTITHLLAHSFGEWDAVSGEVLVEYPECLETPC